MNKTVPAVCLLLLACSPAEPMPDLAETLRKNHATVRSEGVTVENTEKLLRIEESGYTLLARYRATADGHMRIDVFSDGERVYSEGRDELGVWEWPGGAEAPENVYHEGAGALEHGIEFNLFSLAELAGRGHTLELAGRESIGGQPYFVIKVILSDGFVTWRFVNTDTFLVELSRDFRAFHPGLDATKKHLETRYDQWQQVDGVVFAARSQNVDMETGEVIAITTVLESSYQIPRDELNLARSYVPESPVTIP